MSSLSIYLGQTIALIHAGVILFLLFGWLSPNQKIRKLHLFTASGALAGQVILGACPLWILENELSGITAGGFLNYYGINISPSAIFGSLFAILFISLAVNFALGRIKQKNVAPLIFAACFSLVVMLGYGDAGPGESDTSGKTVSGPFRAIDKASNKSNQPGQSNNPVDVDQLSGPTMSNSKGQQVGLTGRTNPDGTAEWGTVTEKGEGEGRNPGVTADRSTLNPLPDPGQVCCKVSRDEDECYPRYDRSCIVTTCIGQQCTGTERTCYGTVVRYFDGIMLCDSPATPGSPDNSIPPPDTITDNQNIPIPRPRNNSPETPFSPTPEIEIIGIAQLNSGTTLNPSFSQSEIKNSINQSTALLRNSTVNPCFGGEIDDLEWYWDVYSDCTHMEQRVLYVDDGDLTLNLSVDLPSGAKTILIEGGNLLIKNNVHYGTGGGSFGAIVLKDGFDNGGNIYLYPNVTNVVGAYYAEGSLISVNSEGEFGEDTSADCSGFGFCDRSYELRDQLYWQGSIFSRNTTGGADSNPVECPEGISCNSREDAEIYDLAYLRTFQPESGGSQVYPDSEAALIIKYDSRIQNDPPPLFSTGEAGRFGQLGSSVLGWFKGLIGW